VTIRFPIGHFLFASSDSFTISRTIWPQYIRYRRQTDGHNIVA